MFKNKEIIDICNEFGIICNHIGDVIDTSRSEDDRRYNFKINHKYFLKINNSKTITESFLSDVVKLIEKYRTIGIYCPDLIRSKYDMLSYKYVKDDIKYTCYIEECAPYSFYEESEQIDYEFKKTIVKHLGKLATQFTDVDLSHNRSMWSLIELGPFNTDIDEKQENLDMLINTLQGEGYDELADKLVALNKEVRSRIKRKLDKLPRCVYQGDLNNSNILVDESGKFKGIIDFNLFGTEVNINCFLNEAMYYLTMEDFKTLSAKEIFNKMEKIQDSMMTEILETYTLNNLELEVLQDYKRVIYMSFHPNVMLWINLISKRDIKGKVIELINMILTI